MSEILKNLEDDLGNVDIDYAESRLIPIMQAQVLIEGVKQLTRIADSLEALTPQIEQERKVCSTCHYGKDFGAGTVCDNGLVCLNYSAWQPRLDKPDKSTV